MLQPTAVFSGYSSNDIAAARRFYVETLGLEARDAMGGLDLRFPNGQRVFIYPKPDHRPATFTVLNFVVPDLAAAVEKLTGAGVEMERYPGIEQDQQGIAHGNGQGPDIAWFADPAGNIIAVIQDDGSGGA
jgi:catechol 2,3-dioxygenase-like lactoylglutathione lyase family enzyme